MKWYSMRTLHFSQILVEISIHTKIHYKTSPPKKLNTIIGKILTDIKIISFHIFVIKLETVEFLNC